MSAVPRSRRAHPSPCLSRASFLLLLATVFFLPPAVGPAFAGPNTGGVLLVHTDDSIVYSGDQYDYAGESGIQCNQQWQCPPYADCVANVHRANPTSGRGDQVTLFWVLAAFPKDSCPHVKGTEFGLSWTGEVQIVDWGNCADFEIVSDDWPYGGAGESAGVAWRYTQKRQLVEVYWFAAYADAGPAVIQVTPHPTQGGYFGDNSVPAVLDAITGWGTLGMNGAEGFNPEIQGPPGGACCAETGECTYLTQAECVLQGGDFIGQGIACDPHPCALAPPPVLSVAPRSLSLDLIAGETRRDQLVLSNYGRRDLTYELTSQDVRFPESLQGPLQGEVAGGGSATIEIEVSAVTRDLGDHLLSVEISSNDPTRPDLSIPIDLRVDALIPTSEPDEGPTFYRPTETGSPGTVLVRAVDPGLVQDGDEITIFAQDRPVGVARYHGLLPLPITVWKSNTFLGLDGIDPGDRIQARVWSLPTGTLREISALDDAGKTAVFGEEYYTSVNLSPLLPSDTEPAVVQPPEFEILSTYPNPTNDAMELRYRLPRVARLQFKIYDVHGRLIWIDNPGLQASGTYAVHWNGTTSAGDEVGSGVYYLRVRGDRQTTQRRLLMVR